ncbi:MAG: RNA polymerase sigma factor [Microbacterium sp.]
MAGDRFGRALDAADDRIVADRAADGDTGAFAVLVRRYTPMMRAYARRVLSGTADVDDVVQDAFITAWEQLPTLEEPARVKSWLMRITGRKAIDRLRQARPQVALADIDPPAPDRSAPPRQVEARAGVEALNEALRRLPSAQRECWVLRELGGCSYEEMSRELDLPVSTVRGNLARARKDILIRMEQWR